MSDSACCSSSNLVDNADDVDSSSDPFQEDNWNSEAEVGVEQPNDINAGFNQSYENGSVSYIDNAIRLEFPKFSKGFKASDFREFVRKYVGKENVEKLENWKYPNLWIMQVKTKEIRENLLRIWKTKIKKKTCWINPYYEYELRGFLHWLPQFISDDDVKRQLSQYGDVLFLENEVHDYWSEEIKSEVKYFGLRLKDGMVKNDLPHFLKFGDYRSLVIVRGRNPACFHCREFGHSKKDCKKYKEKLDEYCKNTEAGKPRTKPRGRRHIRPKSDTISNGEDKKHQNDTNSTLTSTIPAQKDCKLVKSCLKPSYSDRRLIDNKTMEEILAILRSLKEWKEEITEMMEQTLKNIEENSRMNLTQIESEAKEESFKFPIEIITKSLDGMKQIFIEMIEQTLNNSKNIVSEYFGLDSNQSLEKLINNFEPRKEKFGPKEVKLLGEQLLSYTSCRRY